MKKSILYVVAACVLIPGLALAMSAPPEPPGQPSSGFGSPASYICNGYTEYETGSGSAGTRVWWFVPDVLKNGDSAPVVIFLHGFMLVAPDIYGGHIEHLCRQGYIVIYPQFNKGGLGMLDDMDQTKFLDRAIDSVNVALSLLGPAADTGDMTLYGHSVGGLLGVCWAGGGGPAVQAMVLANPCLDASAGMPDFVPVNITTLDYNALAPATTCPVTILWGEDDDLATWGQQVDAVNALVNSPDVAVYAASTDDWGDPALKADHMAPIQDDGWMPSWAMGMFGGDGEEDAMDFRYYYSVLDAVLAGAPVAIDMGAWSDGNPVLAPARVY